jgi:hypothetical protein
MSAPVGSRSTSPIPTSHTEETSATDSPSQPGQSSTHGSIPASLAALTPAAAARGRAMARIAAQQEAAARALAASSSTNLSNRTDSRAQGHAQSLVEQGSIPTGEEDAQRREARQRLRSLSPPLSTQTECDDLREALQDKHEEGAINLQTYRMYVEALTEPNNAHAAGPTAAFNFEQLLELMGANPEIVLDRLIETINQMPEANQGVALEVLMALATTFNERRD